MSNYNWNEADYPRDEEGKFTFKNGAENAGESVKKGLGQNQTEGSGQGLSWEEKSKPLAKDVLYKDEKVKRREEEEKNKYANELLDILGDRATSADKLYQNVERLERRVKEEGLEDRLHKIKGVMTGGASGVYNDYASWDEVLEDRKKKVHAEIKTYNHNKKYDLDNVIYPSQQTIKNAVANDTDKFSNKVDDFQMKIVLSKYVPVLGKAMLSTKGADAAGMLNLAEGKYLPLYTKNSKRLDNINDFKINSFYKLEKMKPYMEQKINEQFKDYGYNLKNINGYIFKSNSAIVKRIKESDDFKRILADNQKQILNGKRFSGRFKNNSNLHNAFGSVDFLNAGTDIKGNLHLYMFDTYDFNKHEGALVEAGRQQMLKGNLKGFFSVCEIIIPKDKLEKKYGIKTKK